MQRRTIFPTSLMALTISDVFFHSGTWAFCPPEWICEGEYLGRPATIWSLGVLLFNLVCRDLPFHNEDNSVYQNLRLAPDLSAGEKRQKHHIYTCIANL